MDISDERLGELWRMPDHYMRPISFGRAVALAARSQAIEEAIAACQTEAVEDTGPTDSAYNRAIGHVSDAIRLLGEDAGKP